MSKAEKIIEFRAGTVTAMTAIVRDLDIARLDKALQSLFGSMDEYFTGEPAVIDLSQLKKNPADMDWAALSAMLRRYGLQPMALKNVPEALHDSARAAGFALLSAPVSRNEPEPEPEPEPVAEPAAAEPPPAAHVHTTRVIDRPVRSGQQIYARDGDLILLNGVSPGAEVIADGSIHCYGPLRGRAVAGAQGNAAARIFCSNFGPELISIAGVFRTFERGIDAKFAAKPAQAFLRTEPTTAANSGTEKHSITIEPLQLD
jgi:septum site-determining protein MinC